MSDEYLHTMQIPYYTITPVGSIRRENWWTFLCFFLSVLYAGGFVVSSYPYIIFSTKSDKDLEDNLAVISAMISWLASVV